MFRAASVPGLPGDIRRRTSHTRSWLPPAQRAEVYAASPPLASGRGFPSRRSIVITREATKGRAHDTDLGAERRRPHRRGAGAYLEEARRAPQRVTTRSSGGTLAIATCRLPGLVGYRRADD